MRLRISDMSSGQRAYLVSGIVRRLNLVNAKLENDVDAYDNTPEIPVEYLKVVYNDASSEASQLFVDLYRVYIKMQNSAVELTEQQLVVQ